MRLACGYSKLPRRRGYWNGCSQRDFMGQMLPQVIRQVSVFASALPINELGCVTKCFRFSEQLWPWLSWYVFALPLCHVICGNSPEMFGFCHHPLSSQSDGSLAFLTEIKIAELFISLEARPLGPVWHDFYFFLFYFFFLGNNCSLVWKGTLEPLLSSLLFLRTPLSQKFVKPIHHASFFKCFSVCEWIATKS